MTGTHYFGSNPPSRDWDRIEMFEPFDVLLCGKGTPAETIARLAETFPQKQIGEYIATLFELNTEEQKTYPGPMSNRYTGVGRVVGLMNEETVAWQAARAKASVGKSLSSIAMADNADPKQPIGDPRLYSATDIANWREWVPKTMAAIRESIGDAQLVANVGHGCNPVSTNNPELRACYLAFCQSVNGIGIEKKTGNPMASYTPASFQGPYAEPRCHFAFAQDVDAINITDAMLLPPSVVKSYVKWAVLQIAGEV